MMRIAVPLSKGRFCPHFGGAEEFALYAVDRQNQTVNDRSVLTPPEHGRGVYPMWLKRMGAELVLAGGMGPRAVDILEKHGIQVVLGVQGDEPDVLVRKFLEGSLETTDEVCRDQGFHDCGHHHGPGGQGAGRGQRGRGGMWGRGGGR